MLFLHAYASDLCLRTETNNIPRERRYLMAPKRHMHRVERPLRERPPKKSIEEDPAARAATLAQHPVPEGAPEFKEGYRECLSLYALYAPDRRNAGRELDRHCVLLEDVCVARMTRENVARYEGYRQALKDLRKAKRIR